MKGASLLMFFLFASVVAFASSCSEESRYRVLSVLFEGVPKPGEKSEWKPVVRRERREPPAIPTPSPTPVEMAAVEKPFQGREWFAALVATLPKDKPGNPDMARALNEKLIKPRPGIADDAKDQAPLNLDVVLEPAGQPAMKVVFSHKVHTQWLACANCHAAIFKMKKGADQMKMAQIFAGQFCARCHGKVAFAIPTGCPRCHPGMVKGN